MKMRDPFKLVDKIDEMKIRVREDFPKLIELYRDPFGVVVGSGDGRFSEHLLSVTGENLTLFSVNRWSENIEEHKLAKARLARFGDRSRLVDSSGSDAAGLFQDGFFDFVYLDGAQSYDDVKGSIAAWWPKAKDGAIFAGHDYAAKRRHDDVARAVGEHVRANRQELFLTHEEGASEAEKVRSFYLFKNMVP